MNCWEVSITIKPIETYYNGYRFRSRLEARWAVFFDAMGVEYEYEPEGFDLGGGIYYLPDFYLPEQDYYVEVKGNMTEADREKTERFFDHLLEDKLNGILSHGFVILGNIPPRTVNVVSWAYARYARNWDAYSIVADFPYLPCVCPICGKFGFEWDGLGERICGNEHPPWEEPRPNVGSKISLAYDAARQARFEHGEQYA